MARLDSVNFSIETLPEHDGDFLFIEKYPNKEAASIQKNPLWKQLDVIQSGRYTEISLERWIGISATTANYILDDLFKYLANNPALANT